MSNDKVTLEINGRKIEATPGSMIIQVADEAGIPIPRFCYHHKLSIAANCRMCMVEVKKAPKPLPACATPVGEGMQIFTESELARDAQKGTMEFLLINHPLDCPICDQGGECELQDLAVGYGDDVSRFNENKRVVKDKDIGPLIATDMTRCIHCTRCVRFGDEIAGVRELGATGRGEFMEIGTYIAKSVDSEMSGNVIDLCPVGALTAKPSRYKYRPWELSAIHSVAAHDAVGSNIAVHIRNGKIVRIVPADNESINECWLSDRDRFSYQGNQSPDRATRPMIKQAKGWMTVDWSTALNAVHKQFADYAPEDIAAVLSPGATIEEQYLAQKYLRGIGVNSIDHRVRQLDFSHQDEFPLFPWLGTGFSELENEKVILMVGLDARRGAPIVGHRIRNAAKKGAEVSSINLRDYDFRCSQRTQITASAQGMVEALAAVTDQVCKKLKVKIPPAVAALTKDIEPTEQTEAICESLTAGNGAIILLGQVAAGHPQYSTLVALANTIASATGSVKIGFLNEGPNSAGAWLAGCVPHRETGGHAAAVTGRDFGAMLQEKPKALLVHGLELESDSADPAAARAMLEDAEFVVAVTSFITDDLLEQADVILPMATAFETSGTFVNAAGQWQSFKGAVAPQGEARPAWKLYRVLGNLGGLEGFEFTDSRQVRDEIKSKLAGISEFSNVCDLISKYKKPAGDQIGLSRISDLSIYACDPMTRRAPALQATNAARDDAARINSTEARKYGLNDGDLVRVSQDGASVEMTLKIDDSIPSSSLFIYSGQSSAAQLRTAFGPVKLEKV
ncbi:MAG: NADH-quinone oxidoreductase subunit NuoG [Thiotrichales bacterium]